MISGKSHINGGEQKVRTPDVSYLESWSHSWDGLREEDTLKFRAQNQDWDGPPGHLVHPCAMLESLVIILAQWLSSFHVHTSTDGVLATC